ncbi:hypothetical protein [Azospirillum picis]|uniref:Uncharacterized protein n=1 Tax=Azospirillum picis TaxID=488438 RepID=A0ABU0MF53_9PROT|nr:hypothetical protein [Azospirillum picis]MBP2298220.1 hypothetical protein [Azospirillum picis]MDQ0532058.1 hypothetical protein [Azospirillum picis]
MDVSKTGGKAYDIQGSAVIRQTGGASPASPSVKSGGGRAMGPVDTVFLSEQASRALSVDLSAKAFSMGATASPELAAAVKDMDKIIPAMQRHGEEASRYMEKLSALARDKFGLGDNVSIMTSGAGNAMLDNLAKENGLEKPEIPEILKESGLLKDDSEADAQSRTGLLSLSVTAAGDPDFGKRMDLAFDRQAKVPADKQTLVALTNGDPATAGTSNSIKNGVLAGLTDLGAGDGASLFAITDGGKDGKATVAASIRSVGMNDRVDSSALDLLKMIGNYLPG